MSETQELTGLDALIAALQIFRKYGNPTYPTCCEHDVLHICGIDPDVISQNDIDTLDNLGFAVDEEEGSFYSFRFGSA